MDFRTLRKINSNISFKADFAPQLKFLQGKKWEEKNLCVLALLVQINSKDNIWRLDSTNLSGSLLMLAHHDDWNLMIDEFSAPNWIFKNIMSLIWLICQTFRRLVHTSDVHLFASFLQIFVLYFSFYPSAFWRDVIMTHIKTCGSIWRRSVCTLLPDLFYSGEVEKI